MAKNTKQMSSGQESLLAQALASAANAAFITDNTGRIVWINDAFSRLSGYSASEALGHTPSFLKSERQNASFYRELWETILAGNVWRGEVVERRKDGTLYTVDEVITPLHDTDGTVFRFLAIQNDITVRKQEADRERFLAYHDALTGLPNRVFFADVLRRTVAQAASTAGRVIIFFLDLDNFKPINDSLGHAMGDQLLVAVAERLNMTVRKTDIVARLGGDEFGILLVDLTDVEVASVAQNILHRISQPFSIQSRLVHTTASIGISTYPALGTEAEELLNKADRAMYHAKRSGRNNYQFAEIE